MFTNVSYSAASTQRLPPASQSMSQADEPALRTAGSRDSQPAASLAGAEPIPLHEVPRPQPHSVTSQTAAGQQPTADQITVPPARGNEQNNVALFGAATILPTMVAGTVACMVSAPVTGLALCTSGYALTSLFALDSAVYDAAAICCDGPRDQAMVNEPTGRCAPDWNPETTAGLGMVSASLGLTGLGLLVAPALLPWSIGLPATAGGILACHGNSQAADKCCGLPHG